MRMRWFGEPWPTAEMRAPICDDDRYRFRTPVGKLCIICEQPIEAGDRGVIMGANPGMTPTAWYEDMFFQTICAAHIDCHVGSILHDYPLPFSRKGE